LFFPAARVAPWALLLLSAVLLLLSAVLLAPSARPAALRGGTGLNSVHATLEVHDG
jgi:hypothetical protein